MSHLKNGESGVVISVGVSSSPRHGRHRRRHGFQKRLEDLGLTPGAKVTVVKSAPFRGPIELQVRGSRLAVGRGMAERILVMVAK